MSDFTLNILGCGSATPTMRHLPSCQAIEYRGRVMLVDCGEGAQLSVRRQRLKFSRITDIFISHLHGDHFLGLPGLLSTMALHEKGGTVTVHVFEQGADVIRRTLDVVCHELSYDLQFNILKPEGGLILDDNSLKVTAFPLAHRVPCVGFRFDEKPKGRHMRGDMIEYFKIPRHEIPAIRAGADFVTAEGEVIVNERITTPADPSASYAYCSDTMFCPEVAESVKGVTLLYHEATYTEQFHAQARERGHSTAAQAAEIARMAGAGTLLLGHYSQRYENAEQHLAEARAIFPNTIAADEGMKIDLN